MKTKILIDCIKTIQSKKVLVTVPFNSILDSWNLELEKWFPENNNITIINQRSLSNVDLNDYHLIICDEIHTLSDLQLMILRNSNKTILGATGSLGKKTKSLLRSNLQLKIIFEYSIEQAINDGIISNYIVNIHYLNLDNTIKNIEYGTKKKPLIGTEQEAYKWYTNQFEKFKFLAYSDKSLENIKYQYANKRATLIYNSKNKLEFAKELIKNSYKCLIFTTRTNIADKLAPNSFHSKSDDEESLENFKNNKIRKLAVCNMASMGITVKKLKHLVVHQLQSSEEMAMQKFLRAMNFDNGENAVIDLIVLKDTQDENWVKSAINFVPSTKINLYYYE